MEEPNVEPSVLDYLKSVLSLRREGRITIPAAEPEEEAAAAESAVATAVSTAPLPQGEPLAEAAALPRAAPFTLVWPWRSLLALGLALLAQRSLEPAPNRGWAAGAILYLLAAAFLLWAAWRAEWRAPWLPAPEIRRDPLRVNARLLLAAIPLALFSLLTFGGNRFTTFNVAVWLTTTVLFVWGFWLPGVPLSQRLADLAAFLQRRQWNLRISSWSLVILGAAALAVFFRVDQLQQVPPEMVSDHAEKLLDVWDVLQGQTSIFFPRNTGREALQMYLTALIIRVFGTGFSFLSLKIGAVLAGLLTLPFIYLLGVEIGNRRVGLLAMLFAGIAYWPNVISRVGLRFPLYPLFVAPALYFLVRGLRNSNRNDFILAGLALGVGLHGYTPIRILPLVVVVGVLLYLLHAQSGANLGGAMIGEGMRRQALFWLLILGLVSLAVFLPLLRFALDNPDLFSYRSLTRLGSVERPLPGPAWQIFLGNLWRGLTMFAWDDGDIWVHSVTHRPVLDVVSGALFHLGVLILLMRYWLQRHWLDLFLLLSLPLLMLPSILSLAFPAENPSLNRMSGAIVPVFLLVGLAGDTLWRAIQEQFGKPLGEIAAWGLGSFLLIWSASQNYDLVFRQYKRAYQGAAWNTSEMGAVIGNFAASVGSPDSAWVVAYPHWVDTRLVGINAGYPLKDYAIWPEQIAATRNSPGTKLFLVKPEDETGLQTLGQIYPSGVVQRYASESPGHDFLMYFVPPDE